MPRMEPKILVTCLLRIYEFCFIGLYMLFELLQEDVLIRFSLLFLFQSASQVRPGQFAAGFIDASVRIFDVRTPDR